ncbi:MAG TPA: CRTAC1 family protein [Candidatus Sulfotelmatobacter sp.]|nr:CRTAC1 family protein [Candidatus Sulfotelmatobacter sp.]
MKYITLLLLTLSALAQQPSKPVSAAPKAAAGAGSPVQFVDVTSQLGIDFVHQASPTTQKYLVETMGAGVAVFDCDGDGRLDIFFVNGARIDDPMPKGALPVKDDPKYWNRLYHQKPDGTFEDVTAKSGLAGSGYGMGVAVGDYDNDGLEDLYVTGFPSNHLYHNKGNCTFEDVTESAHVGASGWSASAAFVDVDNDGLLDLVVTRYLVWSFDNNPYCGEHVQGHRGYCSPDIFSGISPILFHNDGGGHFSDVSEKAGLAKLEGKGLGIAIGDMDRDGLMDIVIANDAVREFLLHNEGGGVLKEIAVDAGTAVNEDGRVFSGMGVDFADYDNDGYPDIVITNLSDQKYALYHNAGNGSFTYDTGPSGLGLVTRPYAGWGVKFFDFDNDGWKDLFIAQGHVMDTIELTFPHLRYLQPPLLLHNEAGKKFTDVSAQSGAVFKQKWAARGLAVGDLSNSGALDVVVSTNNGPAYVLRNQGGNRNHWLTLQLEGRKSNRDGIGAEVKMISVSGAAQYATVNTTGSYLSASDRRVHFGLGGDASAKSIEIRWPSGIRQRLENVPANQILKIVEPDQTPIGAAQAPAGATTNPVPRP